MTPEGYEKTCDHLYRCKLGPCLYMKMPETSMHTTTLLNTLYEFTRGVEDDKDSFIQKALKKFKTIEVRSLNTPRLDVPAKKTAYKLFCKDVRKINEDLKDVPVSKASAIISKEGKKLRREIRK